MSCLNQVIDQPLARQPKLDRPQFLIVKNGHGSGLYIYIHTLLCYGSDHKYDSYIMINGRLRILNTMNI